MSFTVTGTLNSEPYQVGVHPTPPAHDDAVGCVMGSVPILSLLDLRNGEEVQTTPTSSPVTLDVNDPETVLAALYEWTVIGAVEGDDIPDVLAVGEGDSSNVLY